MTDELTKTFFNTFNIEPIGCNDNKNCTGALDCTQCPNAKYPQISDSILLELICFNNRHYVTLEDLICPKNIETIKESVLKKYIERNKEFVDNGYSGFGLDQVRTLFEEGR